MKALRKGDRNSEVKHWQFFLVGQGHTHVVADGDFGSKTEKATKEFQTKFGMISDGVVGNECYREAMKLGFLLVTDLIDKSPGSLNWPAPPSFSALNPAKIRSLFGSFDFTILPDKSNIKIKGDWESRNIISVEVPELIGLVESWTA